MKNVCGYIRVSTVKQGTGVSLLEQKEAIIRYAERHNLNIIEWFEEKETAAKQGRPLFNKMMKLLKDKKASGVIFHKIDRGSRNYKDWAAIDDLIVSGSELHFAHESLDMNTRAGRLTADMLQALATDYIRNLREEATKGLYGRLKQGIYPFGAPIGYIDNGGGKVKTVDPINGPLIKKVFELYATGKYNLSTLTGQLHMLGLRNSKGSIVSVQTLSKILNNPFYTGVLKVKDKTFQGKHQPLISLKTYKTVQEILNGKTNTKTTIHNFAFKKLIKCSECHYSLTGETRKGFIYYRCHTKGCLTKSVREEIISMEVNQLFGKLKFTLIEEQVLNELLNEAQNNWASTQKGLQDSIQMMRQKLENKFQRLTDAYIDGIVDQAQFEVRKEQLMIEQQELRSSEGSLEGQKQAIFRKAKNFFGLLNNLKHIDKTASNEQKRKLLKIISSDITVRQKKPMITMVSPFYEIANRCDVNEGGHLRNIPRTKIANMASSSALVVCSEGCVVNNIITETNQEENIKDPGLRARMKNLLELILSYCEKVDTQEFEDLDEETL
jgi:DNA invertase Pin-like site-specific DNA recombinase